MARAGFEPERWWDTEQKFSDNSNNMESQENYPQITGSYLTWPEQDLKQGSGEILREKFRPAPSYREHQENYTQVTGNSLTWSEQDLKQSSGEILRKKSQTTQL